MAKNTIKIDFANNRIIIDKTFAKKASDVRSEEYALLQQVRNDYPAYIVVVREIKKNPKKESYKGLTYKYMRNYIDTFETEENRQEVHAEMDKMIFISQCHSQSKRYPVIRKWFLEKYPEVKEFGVMPIEDTDSAEDDTFVINDVIAMPPKANDNVANFPADKTA